jgi:hypothetical protein
MTFFKRIPALPTDGRLADLQATAQSAFGGWFREMLSDEKNGQAFAKRFPSQAQPEMYFVLGANHAISHYYSWAIEERQAPIALRNSGVYGWGAANPEAMTEFHSRCYHAFEQETKKRPGTNSKRDLLGRLPPGCLNEAYFKFGYMDEMLRMLDRRPLSGLTHADLDWK